MVPFGPRLVRSTSWRPLAPPMLMASACEARATSAFGFRAWIAAIVVDYRYDSRTRLRVLIGVKSLWLRRTIDNKGDQTIIGNWREKRRVREKARVICSQWKALEGTLDGATDFGNVFCDWRTIFEPESNFILLLLLISESRSQILF